MKTQLFIGLLLALLLAAPASTTAQTVYFNSGKTELDETAKKTIATLWSDYQKTTNKTIYLAGFSDTVGNEELNIAITQQRLESVKAYLNELGYIADFFEDNYGESKSLSAQKNEGEKRKCRKVELQIIGAENLTCKEDLAYTELFQPAASTKNLASNAPDTIVGKDGTIVAFQANSFVDKDGNPVQGNVAIQLEEYNTLDALIKGGLSTQTADNSILQTGGTINITATINGEEVFLDPNKPLAVKFPAKQENDSMELYAGNRDEAGRIVWDISPSSLGAVMGFPLKTEPANYYSLDSEGDTIEKSAFITTLNPKGETVRAGKIWRRGEPIIFDTLKQLTASILPNNTIFLRFSNIGFINLDKSIKINTGVEAQVIAMGESNYAIYAILIDRNGVATGIRNGKKSSTFNLSKTEKVKFIAIGKNEKGEVEYAEANFDSSKRNYVLKPSVLEKPEDLSLLSMN